MLQSPGGRKFVLFLAVFSSFVMKRGLVRELGPRELLLSKSVSRQKELRQLLFRNLVELDSQACSTAGE
jgi:hypothetical protein